MRKGRLLGPCQESFTEAVSMFRGSAFRVPGSGFRYGTRDFRMLSACA